MTTFYGTVIIAGVMMIIGFGLAAIAKRQKSKSIKDDDTINVEIAEFRRIRQARKEKVIRRAKDIFADKAENWLNAPNPALGGQVPMQLIETEEGAALVLDVLGRIEWGVYS